MSFLWWVKLKQQICYSFTLLIPYMFLTHLKWQSDSFRLHQVFQILMVQMLFPPNSTGHWPWLQKGRKIPDMDLINGWKTVWILISWFYQLIWIHTVLYMSLELWKTAYQVKYGTGNAGITLKNLPTSAFFRNHSLWRKKINHLFVLMLYAPVNNFQSCRDIYVFLGWTSS